MQKGLQVVIGLAVILAILLILVFVVPGTGDEGTQPDQDTDTSYQAPQGWQISSDERTNLRFAHPADATVGYEVGRVKVQVLGDGNVEGSEVTDGLTWYAEVFTPSGDASLESAAQEVYAATSGPTLTAPTRVVVNDQVAYRFSMESQLGGAVTHLLLEDEREAVFVHVTYTATGVDEAAYVDIAEEMAVSISYVGSTAEFSEVEIALLDIDRSTTGPERGCDRVVMVERSITPTEAPLTAALELLFSLESEDVEGHHNFIASTNDTLSFERAAVEDGVAHIYLRGELSGLAGVCDNPRAAIQIEETALQFDTVSSVQLYLNDEATDLIPDGRGE